MSDEQWAMSNAVCSPVTSFGGRVHANFSTLLLEKYQNYGDSEDHKNAFWYFVSKQTYLTQPQHNDLINLFSGFWKLFSGLYHHCQLHLHLVENAKLVHQRPYPVPHHANLGVFKNDLQHLLSAWHSTRPRHLWMGCSNFHHPQERGKSTLGLHQLSWAQQQTNQTKGISITSYHGYSTSWQNGYKLFTKLNISMQYYTFKLGNHSCHYFWKIQVQPPTIMGIKQSPDFAQEIMEQDTWHNVKECRVYIDNIGAFYNSS